MTKTIERIDQALSGKDVKFNNLHKEKTKRWKENPYRFENLHYDEALDCFYCPMGQPMTYLKDQKRKTAIGYEQNTLIYRAQNCKGCPMRGPCHKARGNRIIEVNPRLIRYKKQIRERLKLGYSPWLTIWQN